MKTIQITGKSDNRFSWINSRVGEVHEITGERSAGDVDNITGHDEFVVRVKNGTTSFLGCIEKEYAKEVVVGSERLHVADLWPNDQVLIKGEVATCGMTNGAKVEVTFAGGLVRTYNPKNVKVLEVTAC